MRRSLFLVSVALLIGSASDSSAQRRARRPTQRKATVSQVNTLVADPLLPRLPPKYVGDSAGAIYQRLAALSARLKKSEFETTSNYRARVDALLRSLPIDEKRSAADRLSFVHGYGKESYDADTQTFTLSPDVNYEGSLPYSPDVSSALTRGSDYQSLDLIRNNRSVGSRVGRTAIGIRKRIRVTTFTALKLVMSGADTSAWSSQVKFRITPADAREASGKVWLAVNGHLDYPYALRNSDVDTATLDDPVEEHDFNFYLVFVPDSIVVYNIASGEIYATWSSKALLAAREPREGVGAGSLQGRLPNGLRILSKPEPHYPEEARQQQVTGTVLLSVLFTAAGEVTDIQVLRGLPHGLTERAIEAARQIKFVPGEVNGKKVSVRLTLEYNFNLY